MIWARFDNNMYDIRKNGHIAKLKLDRTKLTQEKGEKCTTPLYDGFQEVAQLYPNRTWSVITINGSGTLPPLLIDV